MKLQFSLIQKIEFVLLVWTSQCILRTEAIAGGFAQSLGMMNQQLSKFMEGMQHSVDEWADKVIDNANQEECFYLCPKGQTPLARSNYNHTPTGCTTFGIRIPDEDLPAEDIKSCCNRQQLCYHRCNSSKLACDTEFQQCLKDQCYKITQDKDPKQFAACSAATKLFLMGMLSFGCKTYKDAQRDGCVCP